MIRSKKRDEDDGEIVSFRREKQVENWKKENELELAFRIDSGNRNSIHSYITLLYSFHSSAITVLDQRLKKNK